MNQPFKATHKIIDETGELAYDESDALVMRCGHFYCDRQVWEEGGRYETKPTIESTGNRLVPLDA